MKRALSMMIAIFLLLPVLCGCEKAPAPEVGNPLMAEFTAKDIDGNIVSQQILSGHKLTMVNVWGTFCSPCIQEMPDLGELHTAFGEDFQVVGIVIDAADQNLQPIPTEVAEAKEIIDATGADYLHFLPSLSLVKAFLSEVSSIPVTIFVDENGNQLGKAYIGAKSKAQWQTIITDLLNAM